MDPSAAVASTPAAAATAAAVTPVVAATAAAGMAAAGGAPGSLDSGHDRFELELEPGLPQAAAAQQEQQQQQQLQPPQQAQPPQLQQQPQPRNPRAALPPAPSSAASTPRAATPRSSAVALFGEDPQQEEQRVARWLDARAKLLTAVEGSGDVPPRHAAASAAAPPQPPSRRASGESSRRASLDGAFLDGGAVGARAAALEAAAAAAAAAQGQPPPGHPRSWGPTGGGSGPGWVDGDGGELPGGRPRRGPAVAAIVAAVVAAEAQAAADAQAAASPTRPPRPETAGGAVSPQAQQPLPSPTNRVVVPPIFTASDGGGGGSSSGGAFGAYGASNGGVGPGSRPSTPSKRRSFNTARAPVTLDILTAESPIASALQAQYAPWPQLAPSPRAWATTAGGGGGGGGAAALDSSESGAAAAAVAAQSRLPLHDRVALLAERYCEKLQDITGELGEPTALDIGCMTGALTFCMATSFRHVLGIEADPHLVLAAKELREKGRLEFAARGEGGEEVMQVAEVPDEIDRDRVRFWHCPQLPDLPPKLAPVDAVVLEDGHGRLHSVLPRLLDQVPSVLNPGGVCVISLPAGSDDEAGREAGGAAAAPGGGAAATAAAAAGGGHAEWVKRRMADHGLVLLHEEVKTLPAAAAAAGGAGEGSAAAAAPAAARVIVWKKTGL